MHNVGESFIELSINNIIRYFAKERILMIFPHLFCKRENSYDFPPLDPLTPRIPDPPENYQGKCDPDNCFCS